MSLGKKMIQPPFLKAGDKVALVSPAYWVPEEAIMQAAEQIRSWGLQPVVGPHTTSLNEPCAHRLLLATPESALLSFDIEGGKHFYDIEKEHPQIMK